MKKTLFYLCYFEIIAHNMLRSLVFLDEGFSNAIYLVSMIVLSIISFLNLDKTDIKKASLIIITTLVLAISAYLTHDIFLLTIWLVILAFKGLSFEKIVRFDVLIKSILLIFVVVMYQLDLTNSAVMYNDGTAVYGMGFVNPNVFSSYIMSVVIELLYLYHNKHRVLDFLMVLCSVVLIYLVAGSRTQIVLIVAVYALFLFGVDRLKVPKSKLLKLVCENAFIIMAVVSIAVVTAYMNNPNGMRDLDVMLSGRVHISANVINSYGISLYDTNSTIKELNNTTIDNQYIYVLVTDGILLLLAIGWFFNRYLQFLSKKEKALIYYLMLLFIIVGLVEKIGLRAQYNTFLLCAAEMIYESFSSADNHVKMIEEGDKNE